MPFPAAWPPRPPSGIRSIRFYTSGTTTANFADNAFMFIDGAGANTFTPTPVVPYGSGAVVNNPLTPSGTGATTPPPIAPMLWASTIRICNDGGNDLEYTFDGTNVHGRVKPDEQFVYRDRYEAGISVRGAGGNTTFRIEAW